MCSDPDAVKSAVKWVTSDEPAAVELAARYLVLVFLGTFRPHDAELLLERRMMARELARLDVTGYVEPWEDAR